MLFKFSILVLKSLGRNKVRTGLTGVGVMVLVSVFAVVTNVTSTVKGKIAQGNQSRLLVSERWTAPSRLPVRYVDEIAQYPGVKNYTHWNVVTGFLDETRRRDRQSTAIATRIASLREMQNGLDKLSDETYEAFSQQKDGVLVGPGLMQNMNWQVGQRFTLFASRFPPVDIEFTIVGVLPAGDWSNSMFCRHDYYVEATGDHDSVNAMWVDAENESVAKELAAQLMMDFDNRQPSLKVETESAGVARFAGRSQAIMQIVDGVVLILLIDMVIILSNSISISVRERRVEMAVLKVLGFQPLHIALMIIAEAMFVGAMAGLLGTGVVCLVSELTLNEMMPATPFNRFLLQFPVPWSAMAWGAIIGAAVGLTGSALPASTARSVKVSDVFARIA
jgi:putative ABC transport system permease protein